MTKEITRNIGISIIENVNPNILHNQNELNPNTILSEIKKYFTIKLALIDNTLNQQEISGRINHKLYGYRSKYDYILSINSKTADNSSIITIEPKRIYKLKDTLLIPDPYNIATTLYQEFLGDIYERLLIISESKLDDSSESHKISFYASINLQHLKVIFNKTLTDIKNNNDNEDLDFTFNLITYSFFLIKMMNHIKVSFNNFIEDKTNTEDRMLEDLYGSVGKNLLFRFYTNCYKNKKKNSKLCDESKPTKLKWNNKINILTTFFFDAMHCATSDTENLLECSRNDLKKMLINNFVDKNGNDLKESTVETYLNEYRDDKKALEKNRIIIPQDL